MRPLLHGDISAAARVLLRVPEALRDRLCVTMIREAETAHQYALRTGRMHPLFGNGSLMSAARKRILANEPGFDDVDFCRCFEMVLRQVTRFRISRMHS